MMKKNNIIVLILTSILCLLPIIMSVILYDELPEKVSIHWNSAGEPDSFLPKAAAAFGLPVAMMLLNIVLQIFIYNDPKRMANGQPKTFQNLAVWMLPVLSLILMPITLYIALGKDIPIVKIASLIVGIIFIICGNYLPKCRQNYTIGIRLPWTLADTDNWNKTHRMAGILWIFGGIACMITALVFHEGTHFGIPVILVIAIIMALVPVVYSFYLYWKSK